MIWRILSWHGTDDDGNFEITRADAAALAMTGLCGLDPDRISGCAEIAPQTAEPSASGASDPDTAAPETSTPSTPSYSGPVAECPSADRMARTTGEPATITNTIDSGKATYVSLQMQIAADPESAAKIAQAAEEAEVQSNLT